MADYRSRIDEAAGAGVRFELYQFRRKSYALSARAAPAAEAAAFHSTHEVTARQVRIVLDGGAALLEPGALQYAHGSLQVDMQQNAGGGGFLARHAVRGHGRERIRDTLFGAGRGMDGG